MSDDDRLWLKRVYDWVHADARDPRREEQYRRMVREWAEKKVLDARLATVVLPISIATHPTTPLNEKYTILAAIHDVFCPCDVQVNPWAQQPLDTSLSNDAKDHELALAECYVDLKQIARQMTEAYRDDIERLLAEVSTELEKHSGEQGCENGGSMTQRIEVKDSPGASVNQFIGSSNRASQNQAKEGFLQQIGRQLLRWFSGLLSRPNKPKKA